MIAAVLLFAYRLRQITPERLSTPGGLGVDRDFFVAD